MLDFIFSFLNKGGAEGNVDRIVYKKYFKNVNNGVLIDVGAARPDYLSISKFYREKGWKILSIEPNPHFCEMHRRKGYDVVECACSDKDCDDVDFYIVDFHGATYKGGQVTYESCSSLGIKDEYVDDKKEYNVTQIKTKTRRLDTVLKENDILKVDVLSIDVEGWELVVLQGLDTSLYRPKIMIVENLFNDEKYRNYISKLGYVFWKYLYPNDVYYLNG